MMDGVLVDPTASRSADETKYDGRHLRDKLALLHRAAILLLVTVAVVTMFGDGLMVRSKMRAKQTGFHLVRGERVRSRFDAVAVEPAIDDTSEAERLAREEAAERLQLDAKRRADAATAWADNDGSDAVKEVHHHKKAAVRRMPLPVADSTHDTAVAATTHDIAGESASRPDPEAVDSGPDWSLVSGDSCTSYFGNGFTEFQPLVGGSSGPGEYMWCRKHPVTSAFYCRAHNLQLNPSKIRLSRGGEELGQVSEAAGIWFEFKHG
jgi:hypothetical protein